MSGLPRWLCPVVGEPIQGKRITFRDRTAYQAAYYAENAEKLKARSRARYAADPQSAQERILAWRLKNPEVWREIAARSSRNYRRRRKLASGA